MKTFDWELKVSLFLGIHFGVLGVAKVYVIQLSCLRDQLLSCPAGPPLEGCRGCSIHSVAIMCFVLHRPSLLHLMLHVLFTLGKKVLLRPVLCVLLFRFSRGSVGRQYFSLSHRLCEWGDTHRQDSVDDGVA